MGSATTKHDIIKRVATETEQPRSVVRQITQALLDGIIDELANGKRLEFRDFGVFEVVTRKPRVARNPRTGDPIHVPAKTVVHFKQGRVMKSRVAEYGERLGTLKGAATPAGPAVHDAGGRAPDKEPSGRADEAGGKTPDEKPSGGAGFITNPRNTQGGAREPSPPTAS